LGTYSVGSTILAGKSFDCLHYIKLEDQKLPEHCG
jgi:hypothetical protein